jgi:hypothetical protein
MNHAVLPYLRSISRAATPFFELHISNTTMSQIRTGILVPRKMESVRTENCLRHSVHFHTRRIVPVPVRVLRTSAFG